VAAEHLDDADVHAMASTVLSSAVDEDVEIASRGFDLAGRLTVPERSRGLVVFAQDAGTDARDVGDRHVADSLRRLGFGTLVVNLLGANEIDAGDAFELDVLAIRLSVATRWLRTHAHARRSHVGCFGVRAGASVALAAAADDPAIGAVVGRSARLDLVAPILPALQTPTLLVVGGADVPGRAANERAMGALRCDHQLAVVPGASELFVEPGTLDVSARLAAAWFGRHLDGHQPKGSPTS
jgi:putative phosphoribosyl transferase